jgi:hypothetical protein
MEWIVTGTAKQRGVTMTTLISVSAGNQPDNTAALELEPVALGGGLAETHGSFLGPAFDALFGREFEDVG